MSAVARTCQAFVTPNHIGPTAKKCGEKCVTGYSWCPEHKARFVVAVPKRIPGAKPIGLPMASVKLFHREDFEG